MTVFRDLRRILGWVDGSLRRRWFILIPVMCVAAVLEALGAVALFGLLRLVMEPHRVRITAGVSQVWEMWPRDDPPAIVAALTIAVAIFYLMRGLFVGWAEWLKEATIARSIAQSAERLYAQYLAADYVFHLRRRSTSLIQEVSRSTNVAFQLVVGSAVNILAEVATIGAMVVVLAWIAPSRALIAVIVVVGLVAIPMLATGRVWVRFGQRQAALERQQLHLLQQSLGAVKEVKITGRESFFEARFRATRRALTSVVQRRTWLASALRLSVETTLIVCMLGVVLFVTMQRATGPDTVAVLALFAYTGFRVVPSANRIMLNAGYIREGRAFVQKADEDFRQLPPPARGHGASTAIDLGEALVAENVEFAYDAEAAPVLHGIHLRLRRGESLGIVGPTGAGKSTLVDVLLGLLPPTSGRVLIDGENLAGRERAWQRQVGYVPQDPYLLDDTIRRNVAFGVPDASIDEHAVARACSLAHLDEVIRQLPQGLDTPLGENGVRLSGGQRQRVAIARALYTDPVVLVFDEATGSLDSQTEREVTRAIAALHGSRTLIVIAHRLSTVQACDRLLFMRDGRIVATGTYEELLHDRSFRAMAMPE
jgi:ATP-binding cassette subfamily C protein